MSLRLRIEHGQGAGKTWRFAKAGVYTLGRGVDNSIRVLDMKVSKTHCEIRVADAGGTLKAVLHDPGSTHGCELNGQPVPRQKDVPMKPGDELRLGLSILRLLSAGDSDEDARPVEGRAVAARVDAGGSREAASTATLPPDQLVGKKLGGYQIEKKIGAGGMGGVYLAEQVSLNRKVALKVLNETFAADSAFVDQFVNEARAAGALNHPNVVQVYDVGNDQGHYFFSMEVMPGGSIEEKIRAGNVEWEEGLNWFLDATNALIFAKRRDILHRDVKPDNLMIGEDDSAKLCDLGLAKKSEVSDLMDQGIIGTPHFISPEAIRRKNDIDHRTDLYSLGCSFYRVFTGKNPYPAGTVKDILLGHLNSPVPNVNAINSDVPKEIAEIVQHLMAKDPEQRIQTPEELLRRLDSIRTRYNLEAHGIKPASRKPLVIGAAAALIAIGGAIFVVMTTESGPSGPPVLTAKQQAALLKGKQDKVRNDVDGFVNTARSTKVGLDTRLNDGDLGPDNYTDPMWPKLSKDYKDGADVWQAKADAWKKAAAPVKDQVIKGHYARAGAEIAKLIEDARETAKKKIDKPIADLKASERQRAEGRTKALEDADRLIKAYGEKIKGLAEAKTFDKMIELETTVRSKELDETVTELLAREINGFKLLKQKPDIDPLLKKYAPITVKDQPRGIQYVQQAVRTINGRGNEVFETVKPLLAAKPSHDGFKAATATCKTFLDKLPVALDAQQADAPMVVAALKKAKGLVEKQTQSIKDAWEAFADKEHRIDRAGYFLMAKQLWNPAEGRLQRFEFKGARVLVENTVNALKRPDYKELVAQWLPLIDAIDGLWANIVAGDKGGGWRDDDFEYIDARGKEKKTSIRAISPEGITWLKDMVPFKDSDPSFLYDKLFFMKDKQDQIVPRLKVCTASDRAGLGLLAEIAGRYDDAEKQYAAAKGLNPSPELQKAIDARMAVLGMERQAAERVWAIIRWSQGVDAWAQPLEKQALAVKTDPDGFPEREKAQAGGEDRLKQFATYWRMFGELKERADLASTMWGSSLRAGVHPEATYTAAKAPPAAEINDPGPRKRTPKKDDPKKKKADVPK